jgi:hypothetical protein
VSAPPATKCWERDVSGVIDSIHEGLPIGAVGVVVSAIAKQPADKAERRALSQHPAIIRDEHEWSNER